MNTLSQSDIEAFQQLTHDFCKKSLWQFIDEHHPDGNISQLHSLIQQACDIGIIARANSNAAGYEYGIWGKQSCISEYGIISSVAMLSILATVSASFAFFAHIQGLSSNILIRNGISLNHYLPLLVLYGGFLPPDYSLLRNPSSFSTHNTTNNEYFIHTTTGYGYNPHYALVCITDNGQWKFLLFDNTDSILFNPLRTHGLRGLTYKAHFNSKITHSFTVDIQTIELTLAYYWLGLAAIALGTSHNAFEKASSYANQRFQRGCILKNIESVQMMLGCARSSIDAAQKILYTLKKDDSSSLLLDAAECKLNVTTLCNKAVTECLQVFGGYGYMEDFGIERMFRDSTTLVTIGGSPFFMKRFIAQIHMEG